MNAEQQERFKWAANRRADKAEKEWRRWKRTAESYSAQVQTLIVCLKEFENEYPHVTRVLAELERRR